jgi:hypothetical protein
VLFGELLSRLLKIGRSEVRACPAQRRDAVPNPQRALAFLPDWNVLTCTLTSSEEVEPTWQSCGIHINGGIPWPTPRTAKYGRALHDLAIVTRRGVSPTIQIHARSPGRGPASSFERTFLGNFPGGYAGLIDHRERDYGALRRSFLPAPLIPRGFRRITSSTAVCNSAGSGRYSFATIVGPVPLVNKSVRSVTIAWLVVNLAVCQTADRFRLDTDQSCSDASLRLGHHLIHLVHFPDRQYADQFHPLR